MEKFTLVQQQLRAVNAIAGYFGHLFAQADERLCEMFKLAELLTYAERNDDLSGGEWLTIYEHLIEARTIAKSAQIAGVTIGDWKTDDGYDWQTATGRYRVEVDYNAIYLEVWHTQGGLAPEGVFACGGWVSLTSGNAHVRNVTNGCEPRHVVCLLELSGSLCGIVSNEALNFFTARLVKNACDYIGDEMVQELVHNAEYFRELRMYDEVAFWEKMIGR